MNAGQGTVMPEWLRQRALLTPQRVALVTNDGDISFAELDALVESLAAKLEAAGLGPGAMVAALGASSIDYVLMVHAVSRLGAVLLPLNARLTVPELHWQLEDAGAGFLLHDETYAATAAALVADVAGLVSLNPGALPDVAAALTNGLRRSVNLDDLYTILYTSGTTGTPKAAMLTYGNHFWNATASALNMGILPDDRWLICLPLFHVGGMSTLFKSALYGMTAVLQPGFDPAEVNRAIDEDRVTITSVVANMLQRVLVARGDRPFPPWLRCVLLGGGPAPEPLLQECARRGVPVVQTYGLTETASQLATLAPEDALRKLGSAGKPLMPCEVAIGAEDGSLCGPEKTGEILVRGPVVSIGYLNRPEATAQVMRGGWLHTGDAGYLDAEGYLYVLDRRDDLIISGGENVYPAEIEAALLSHPEVSEAGVFGIADERWGQTPAAVVVLKASANVEAEALREFCRQRLARFKVPSRIEFAEALPRGASGKLLRYVLRQDYGDG